MSLVGIVRSQVSKKCIVTRCRKKRCAVSLKKAPPSRLIVDCDGSSSPFGQGETRCDFIFFSDITSGNKPDVFSGNEWIIPMEFKKGEIHASQVVNQLQSGARKVESLVSNNRNVRFLPIAVHRGIHSYHKKRLKELSVKFFRRSTRVRLLPCGSALINAMK